MTVAVIGSGSWGTALAQVVANGGNSVSLWCRRESIACAINETHRNPDYLSDVELSSAISATTSVAKALEEAESVILVVPSKHLRSCAMDLLSSGLNSSVPVLVCTKGVEGDTGFVPVQLLESVIGNGDRLACLSGPNHAEEVILGLPSGTVVASSSKATAEYFQNLLGSQVFRVYTSSDVVGVELCAAAKNVIAIAVGISYGMGLGDNTAAMIMTRGQAEMSRLTEACGGQAITCMGLAGTGDLIATCTSRHSRNRSFGEALAKGETLESFEARRHMVVEGAQACKSLRGLAAKHNVELPIADAVYSILWDGVTPTEAEKALVSRTPKPEFY